jgi:hypothetical protein
MTQTSGASRREIAVFCGDVFASLAMTVSQTLRVLSCLKIESVKIALDWPSAARSIRSGRPAAPVA